MELYITVTGFVASVRLFKFTAVARGGKEAGIGAHNLNLAMRPGRGLKTYQCREIILLEL